MFDGLIKINMIFDVCKGCDNNIGLLFFFFNYLYLFRCFNNMIYCVKNIVELVYNLIGYWLFMVK